MRHTEKLGLALYDPADKMAITAEEDSLNANMVIIDKEVADIKDNKADKADIPAPYDDRELREDIDALEDDKLDKPADPPTAAGKVLRVKSVNDDGTFVCEWADSGAGGGVTDVRVNDASVVDNGVANIPTAAKKSPGVVQVNGYGMEIITSGSTKGYLRLVMATNAQIDAATDKYAPITSNNVRYAVKAALTDANHITLTAAQQQTALGMLGITVDENGICHFG